MYYWFMLALAVVAEVLSTVGMKYAATSSPITGYIVMALMISLSFYAFSRAVVHIPLAVSYAIWEGLGLFLIGVAGVVLFGEYLTLGEMFAIALMLFGLLLVTFDKGQAAEADDAAVVELLKAKPVRVVRPQVKPVRIGTLGEVTL
ncbi:QacE family quaternary ammonium compound efflux SMR transporter [Pseudomonas sp. C27(2019)]|uniref:SMR family transporter n=1 Tax=Pseudomonas sp. C27(2019) TaxID=2604941 RepID=UPI001245B844|nr:SMR family transporter [Pseudomonas sp. C27(2019)]QEY59182.1 QacE family quaternary ammonium compound efflux SMR transporter [Pseudomonas sp. C27(2019)]